MKTEVIYKLNTDDIAQAIAEFVSNHDNRDEGNYILESFDMESVISCHKVDLIAKNPPFILLAKVRAEYD